ncbi:helix-turn-helix domain-containing protein [Vibrio taketomensis]|uniref:helix-turn-helix domain-containing protein n=1 Tax=Vibrio taketomensis TaxID=2572923 RepID=UPI00138A1CB9|nr:helix-turn-helix domain-containing protein [Vibrio taketomensis]
MEIKLHSNAATTPKIRKYIKNSDKSDTELAYELSISIDTVKKWRAREDIYDKSHRPKVIHRRLTPEQEWLIIYLRHRLCLSLDELLEVAQLLINKALSRAVLNRCLKKYQVPRMSKPALSQSGTVVVDMIKLPNGLAQKSPYLLVLTEQYSGFISFALVQSLEDSTAISGLNEFAKHALPYQIQSMILPEKAFVIQWAESMGIAWTAHNASTRFELTTEQPVNFDQGYEHFLDGEQFDQRLGLPSVLLCYEDLLNKRVMRNRLKNLTPSGYWKNKMGS